MITGISVLGLLAGSLASFFRLDNGTPSTESPRGEPAATTAPPQDAALEALTTEVSALRQQVEALTARLTGTTLRPRSAGANASSLDKVFISPKGWPVLIWLNLSFGALTSLEQEFTRTAPRNWHRFCTRSSQPTETFPLGGVP